MRRTKKELAVAEEIDYIRQFDAESAREYVNKQIKNANRQLLRLEQEGLYSQAYERAIADIGIDSNRWRTIPKGTSLEGVLNTYAEILDFRKSPSSSLSVARKYTEHIADKLEELELDVNAENMKMLTQIWNSKEYGRATIDGRLDSDIAMNEIAEAINYGASLDDIKNALQSYSTHEITADEISIRARGVMLH